MRANHDVLGMNERNIRYIYRYNRRRDYPLADDKLITKRLLKEHDIPTPRLIRLYEYFFQITQIGSDLSGLKDFVIKPARSMGGGGIILINDYKDGIWVTADGQKMDTTDLYDHAGRILAGVYSLDNSHDSIMIEEKIQLHDSLTRLVLTGIPDIRIIIFKQKPVMAMLRLPTQKSKGRANLHAGGIGVGINIKNGRTFVNPAYSKSPEFSPDNGMRLTDIVIPFWDEMIGISKKITEIVPLGYMGIDFVIDQRYGPQILELNVRPGLEIQNVNGEGLRKHLELLEQEK